MRRPIGRRAVLAAAGASADARKIGSFKFTVSAPVAGSQPMLLVVLSVDEGSTAECIMCGKLHSAYWRFITGKLSGERMDYYPPGSTARFVFDWRDANGGSVGLLPENDIGSIGRLKNTSFTMLDG